MEGSGHICYLHKQHRYPYHTSAKWTSQMVSNKKMKKKEIYWQPRDSNPWSSGSSCPTEKSFLWRPGVNDSHYSVLAGLELVSSCQLTTVWPRKLKFQKLCCGHHRRCLFNFAVFPKLIISSLERCYISSLRKSKRYQYQKLAKLKGKKIDFQF